jgi:cell division protein FtsL
MTPPATAAASRSLARTASGSRRVAVRHPRRVSGPAGTVRAAAVAIPAPGIALPRERPVRPRAKPRRAPGRKSTRRIGQDTPGLALRAVGAFQTLSASAVLDRLIRGRIWIGLLAFSLIGIVAMQLVVLELNTGIGRTLAREATLQRENAQLGIEDSTYSAESRVAPLAASAGMTLAPPGTVHFVQAVSADISRAAAALSAPVQQVPASSQAESSEASGGSSSTESSGSASEGVETPASSASTSTAATATAESSSSETGAPETGATETSSSTETGGSAEASGSSSGAGG